MPIETAFTVGACLRQHARKVSLAAALLSGGLWAAAFPQVGAAALIFVFAVPLLLATQLPLSARMWVTASAVFGVSGWAFTLVWLRFVAPPLGWLGVAALSVALGAFSGGWMLLAGRLFQRHWQKPTGPRLLVWLSLAALWALLEWVRTWFLTGFPWAPAAAALWQAPALLQTAAWLGQGSVSFAILWINLALAHTILIAPKRLREGNQLRPLHLTGLLRPTPELALAALWAAASLGLFGQTLGYRDRAEPLLRATVVQPWVPAELKWDPARAQQTLIELGELTLSASRAHPEADLLMWPEAATPYSLSEGSNDPLRQWLASLAAETRQPVLQGNVLTLEGAPDGANAYVNGLFLLTPEGRVLDTHYRKRRLVPFGEYVPLRPLFGWLGKVVPLPGDTQAGEQSQLIPVPLEARTLQVGALICYEDIFPWVGFESAEGADLLAVVTNDAWYGTGGGAYQHAAHSVLRAVETRTPLLRCGNHGWSGWIDEWGRVRGVLTNAQGSIYTRGFESFTLQADPRFAGTNRGPAGAQAFHLACGLILLLAAWRYRPGRVRVAALVRRLAAFRGPHEG